MARSFDSLSGILSHGFDSVIDVRSPAEFAEDHIPGAINLPVLDNEERARVGTIYKQQSPFLARKIGAALVFRNASGHIEGPLAHHGGGWRPLVYCWRGGQRSGSFAWMLQQIGWRAEAVDGGYKTYRRLVTRALYDTPLTHRFLQLGGYTGTAKTALLPKLAARGTQVIDLEGLARHRGSLLGAMPGGQPSQKGFETELAAQLARLDPERPVIVEAESSKIGQIILPPSLWDSMKTAPWIEVSAPLEARAAYLDRAYDDILSDGARLRTQLSPLRFHRGHALVDAWERMIEDGARLALCQSLAADHYDPAYDKSMSAMTPHVLERFETPALDDAALERLADRIAKRLQTISI
ncbi:tRNA 2-selenouridine synthase [Salipiger aestuarii]|uniref:tRNA 2-selenouridine synthase n=1 Tax=Salipiger aestuarii TaxID=568098 RepID=A0A327Y9S6_9RHOB|nr:tRNA 2-selenouridine(34) synthase MnmH [Salipiger aestuarii]EIE49617.1 tRNA 2-selenouridine synthase [Citreicella sp. 357]KAA8607171.1 tRNA 2-selenouridine synthase [Salipiger aestuarii]KAB2542293.1 tRNA 2-selenouridine synthase [Salipiger aestuarii]RAK16942.1 tRNA 2-selenouridine synthase [Salipiger aestuarii]